MSDLIPLFIICFLVGGLLLWATLTGSSSAPLFTFLLGAYFIFLPICLALGWTKLFALLITIPLGGLWTFMAVLEITKPLRYKIKTDATYLNPVHVSTKKSTKYYGLHCQYRFGNHSHKRVSEDSRYSLRHLEKRYVPNTTIPIWINKNDSTKFLVKRFDGVGINTLLLILGIGFLSIAVKLILGDLSDF